MRCKQQFILYILSLCIVAGCRPHAKDSESTVSSCEVFFDRIRDSLDAKPEKMLEEIDTQLPRLSDSLRYYQALFLKAKAMMFLSLQDSSAALLQDVETFCVKHPDEPDILSLYGGVKYVRGLLLSRNSKSSLSIPEFKEAYDVWMKYGDKYHAGEAALNLANAYAQTGRYDRAAFLFRHALSIADELRLPEEERYPVYYGLGEVYMELRDFKTCDFYFNLAAESYENMRPFEKHLFLINRGLSYYYRQDYASALDFYRRSLFLTREYPDMDYERNLTYINMSDAFLLMNETDSAAYYLNCCHAFFRETQNSNALYYINTQLMELALRENNIALARKYLKRFVTPAYVEPNMVHIRNKYLERYYVKTGNFKEAYRYQLLNQHIEDSIRNERIRMRTVETALKYQQDSTLMTKEIQIRQQQNKELVLRSWLFGAVMLLLILGIGLSLLILRRRKKREAFMERLRVSIVAFRLQNIRNRISPHFIFNVLNREISSSGDRATKGKLFDLVKLIRRNLELTNDVAVSLADELDFVETYINLEKAALGENFRYDVTIGTGIDIHSVQIPSMLLQIPVENAIKHALCTKQGKRRIWILIQKKQETIEVFVRDNGGGFRPKSEYGGTGIGMKVITQMLSLLNMYNHHPIRMEVNNVIVEDGETGCEVYFNIPLAYSYQLISRNKKNTI